MTKANEKLMQRAELFSIINKYRTINKLNDNELQEDIEKIKQLKDKNFICKTLLNEINNSEGIYSNICSIILADSIESKIFEEESINFLKKEKATDKIKVLIISLFKEKNIDTNILTSNNYIENSDELAHKSITDFLNNAIDNPEVQIDLLDFYSNIPIGEKIYFLDSLMKEYQSDNYANSFTIIAQLDNLRYEEVIKLTEGLIKSKSKYAIEGLKILLKKAEETRDKARIRRNIKKLETEYANYENNELIKNSKIYKCFISFVDGKSDFSIVVSRKYINKTIDILLCTINTQTGINSCMGFAKIDMKQFYSIIKRLYSDAPPIEIKPEIIKSILYHYINKSEKTNTQKPYELIVWKKLLNDFEILDKDISEYINSQLNIVPLDKTNIVNFSYSSILDTWYYLKGENKHFDKLIDKIENEKISKISCINTLIKQIMKEDIEKDKDYIKLLQSNLLIQSYITSLAKLKIISSCSYSICHKVEYIKILAEAILKKSLYNYFIMINNEYEQKETVFKKKHISNFSKEEVKDLLKILEVK